MAFIFRTITLAVWVSLVRAAPAPGVIKETRTLSCCGKVYIPITNGCLNTFAIGNTPHVKLQDDTSAQGPFQPQIEVKECVDFTHTITCDVGESHTRQVIIDYIMTPCSKDNAPSAATVPQGSLLSLLVAIALMMMIF